MSNWVGDQVRAGNVLKVFPPAGSFVLRHPDQALLLFAGGSGIAPIFSLARQALASGAPAVALFYANRNRDTAMLMSELAALQARYVGRLHIKFWYDEVDGLPTESDVVQFAKLVGSGDAYPPDNRGFQECLSDYSNELESRSMFIVLGFLVGGALLSVYLLVFLVRRWKAKSAAQVMGEAS